ncbi:sigma-70 family RNA polymerase sigma factor [Sphingomonas montanisoli]|uniref:Sigma-70 family RNA polymerase sigma factor n=1 Tax=Sphingomonas montanisoli TaxID=2606412 RepID=A0A5D9CD20_9SPHN|nr:sigma-70 family RNA polymerase sigma factor [Sphingomonas montanisoli]TZG29559.1 sigma-70 family RNA polymerase sigma factor [Sphingomonas montanisoli]
MLLRLLTARLGSRDDAEDVLQDLWLKLETLPSGPVAQPAAYLFRMANNLAFDRRRSAARHAVRDTEWLSVQSTAEEMPTLEDDLIARQRLRQIEAAIDALPERTARVFRLFRFEGRQQKAIAAELGLSLSSVEKLLQQGYRSIHDALRKNSTAPALPRRHVDEEDRRS